MNQTDTSEATEIEVEVVDVSNTPLRDNAENESAPSKRPWSNFGQKFNARSPVQRILIALALILGMGFILAAALIFGMVALIVFTLRAIKRLITS
ncbi:MAG: hypothetical protein ACO3RK_01970 [Luteolibacter sp.]